MGLVTIGVCLGVVTLTYQSDESILVENMLDHLSEAKNGISQHEESIAFMHEEASARISETESILTMLRDNRAKGKIIEARDGLTDSARAMQKNEDYAGQVERGVVDVNWLRNSF